MLLLTSKEPESSNNIHLSFLLPKVENDEYLKLKQLFYSELTRSCSSHTWTVESLSAIFMTF